MILRVVLIVMAATAISLGLVLLARVTRRTDRMRGTGDVETAYITAVATLYGIFIAFMIFAVWNRYNESLEATDIEASTMAEMYQLAGGLSEPTRDDLRKLSLEYGRSVVDDEWAAMRRGHASRRTQDVVERTWELLNGPNTAHTDPVQRDHLLTAWSRLTDQRRERLLRAYTGLNEYAYALLVIGGLITLGLACVFTVDDFWTHLLKASTLGCIIGLMLVTIWVLDHPFSSHVRLQPTPFVRVLDTLPLHSNVPHKPL